MKPKISDESKRKASTDTRSKFANCIKNGVTTLKEEIIDRRESPVLHIKEEVDIECCIEDSIYDAEYSVDNEYYDINVKREDICKSDDDGDEFKNDNLSTNIFIDNMFKQVGPLSDSLVECRVCYKQIKETSKRQHCNTHSGLKPFPCCYCGARFTRKGDAMRHRKTIHRNVKPFECAICHKSFAERKILIAHLRNHDRTVYFSCATCGFKFGKKEYFQSHIQYIHPSTKEQSICEMKDIVKKGKKQLEKLLLEEKEEGKYGKGYLRDDVEDDEDLITDHLTEQNLEEDKFEEKNESSHDFKVESSPLVSTFSQIKSDPVKGYNDKSKHNKGDTEEDTQDTDIKTGTLSFTHKIVPQNTAEANPHEDEELVNKAINSAISQSKCVLEKMSCDGSSLTSICERTNNDKHLVKRKEAPSIPVGKHKNPQVHITANFGGSMRKFIIHIPNNNIDPLCKEGLDSLLNMVNQVCSGRDDIIGPVEIELHQLS